MDMENTGQIKVELNKISLRYFMFKNKMWLKEFYG